MRCTDCDRTPVKLQMTLKGRGDVTMHSCACTRRWFHNGRPVALAEVLAAVPKRGPRANRRQALETLAA